MNHQQLLLHIFVIMLYAVGNALKISSSRYCVKHNALLRARNGLSFVPMNNVWRSMVSDATIAVEREGPVKKYLHVPFNDKDEVKSLGAKWDKDNKSWYISEDIDETKFLKWKKLYLNVPYTDRANAKAKGALWDPTEQKWFIAQGAENVQSFKKWMQPIKQQPQKTNFTSSDNVSASKISNSNPPLQNSTNTVKALPPPEDAIVSLDLDTSGLPLYINTKGKPTDYTDLINYDSSRIVQVAYALCDKNTFDKLDEGHYIIQTDGFPIANSQFHGITEGLSKAKGIPFVQAAKKVVEVMSKAKYVIAHNAEFDVNIFKSELYRYGMFSELKGLKDKRELCSMNLTTPVTGLLDKAGKPKKPSLKELVSFSLKEELPTPHNAVQDVEYVRRCLQQLTVVKKIISLPSFNETISS